jgi:hypothetical protein
MGIPCESVCLTNKSKDGLSEREVGIAIAKVQKKKVIRGLVQKLNSEEHGSFIHSPKYPASAWCWGY